MVALQYEGRGAILKKKGGASLKVSSDYRPDFTPVRPAGGLATENRNGLSKSKEGLGWGVVWVDRGKGCQDVLSGWCGWLRDKFAAKIVFGLP